MAIITESKQGNFSPAVQKVASDEGISASSPLDLVSSGRVVIPANEHHAHARPVGIGQKLKTQVNVNLCTSADYPKIEPELEKLRRSSDQ
jgi:phosphomethylpyrimidine synthase